MGALTKLQAVNRMLRGAGESPVSTIEDDGVNDVAMAVAILDEATTMCQMDGSRSFNTEDTELVPDSNGIIFINADTLAIDTRDDSSQIDIAIKGIPPRLYNLTDNTYVFESNLQVKQTILVPFEELPTAYQFEITDYAARVYQMQTLGDTTQDAVLGQIAMRSQIRARANEMRQVDSNFLKTSQIAKFIGNSRSRFWIN